MWVLIMEPRSSARATRALDYLDTSPHSQYPPLLRAISHITPPLYFWKWVLLSRLASDSSAKPSSFSASQRAGTTDTFTMSRLVLLMSRLVFADTEQFAQGSLPIFSKREANQKASVYTLYFPWAAHFIPKATECCSFRQARMCISQ